MTEQVTIVAGRKAWGRLQSRERKCWDDWLCVGRALVVGRTSALRTAKTNLPVGTTYNRAMTHWLGANGLAEVSAQERYRAMLVIENLDAIETWRSALGDAKRRSLNHPAACWHAWRRATAPDRSAPSPRTVVRVSAAASARKGRPVYWSQDAMKRAHRAMLDSRSHDLLTLARLALQAAIRNEADLLDLLDPPPQQAPTTTTKSAPTEALALAS